MTLRRATGTPTIPIGTSRRARPLTEAARSSARWNGRGEKEAADQAAVDAMRHMLQTVTMAGVVVIGEAEKDEAPMLNNGEKIGNGERPRWTSGSTRSRGRARPALAQPNVIR